MRPDRRCDKAFVARVSEAHPGISRTTRVRFAYPGYKSYKGYKSHKTGNDAEVPSAWIPAFAGMTMVSWSVDRPRYQCTPRISAANAICSLLGATSPFSACLSPRAAAESGNNSKAVLMITS